MLGLAVAIAAAPAVVGFDPQTPIREDLDRFFGINLNYMRDLDANRPSARPLDAALADLRPAWLRFPGGEKSDFHLWSEPPYDRPAPRGIGWYGDQPGERMDFDQYIAICRAVKAEPYVVVGYDTEARTGQTRAQWLESAVAWVRYANLEKGYGVRYWEIGNENWHNQTATPEEMAGIVAEFSQAMKAVDPTIRIGASGNSPDWWRRFLPGALPFVDFLSASLYPVWDWGSFARYAAEPPIDFRWAFTDNLAAIREAGGGELPYFVAETNSKDFAENGWPDGNNLGHALVTFELLGQAALHPQTQVALVWTTRWADDAEAARSQWYALGPENQVLPTGQALALWTQHCGTRLFPATSSDFRIIAFATDGKNPDTRILWLLNRATTPLPVQVEAPAGFTLIRTLRWGGGNPDDPNPAPPAPVSPSAELPGASLSVFFFEPGGNR